MEPFDLLIEGGTVVAEGVSQKADIGVSGGRIIALLLPGRPGMDPQARERLDARGCLVLPGGVDAHTHIYWPLGAGTRSRDSWFQGTVAAAIGGTTTIIDFVPDPGDGSLVEAFQARRAEAEGNAVIDFAFHSTLGRIDQRHLDELRMLVREGVSSFKVFTCGPSGIDEGSLIDLFVADAEVGGRIGFHAESDAVVRRATERLIRAGSTTPASFPESRPAIAEELAVQTLLLLARRFSTPIHIFHLSTAAAGWAIERAQMEGVDVTVETCPHYLLFNESVYRTDRSLQYLISPPIRTDEDRDYLWRALAQGTIACVTSDSIAYDLGIKAARGSDFRYVPLGAAGIQVRLGLIFRHGVLGGLLTPERWVEVMCTGPAKVFSLYPAKGTIRVGSDADLVILDPKREMVITADATKMGVDYTIFDSLPCTGWPRMVIKGGRVIVRDGEFTGSQGTGRYLGRPFGGRDCAAEA